MPKKRWVELNTEIILMSAEKVFEKKGYEAASVDDIALQAGISKSTIYVYFKSKQLIWDHIVCKYMEQLLEAAEKASEGKGSFEKRYYQLCFDIAEKFEEHPMFYNATLGRISMDMEQEVYKKIYDIGEQTNEAIADFIRSGIKDGVIKKDIDVYPAVIMMWSSISGIISMAMDKEEYLKKRFGLTKKEYLKKAFRMLLEGAQ